MPEQISLPEEMLMSLGPESKEFAVKSRRSRPPRSSVSQIIFGIVWLAFVSFFIYLFLGPLLKGEEVQMTVNGTPQTISLENLKPARFLIIFLSVFVIIGLWLIIAAVVRLFRPGGYFAGTATRLIYFRKGVLKSYDWEQFTGNIEVWGKAGKGNIMLEMRTGRMVSSKSGSRYVPDVIYILGVPDIYEIEQIVRRRIKENDPTKATT